MPPSWDDGAFGDDGDDPFGVSGDVFGRDLGDVDPFDGNDSFDGDKEWGQFNPDNDDDNNRNKNKGGAVSQRRSATKPPRTSSSTSNSSKGGDPESPRKKKGRKPSGGSSRKLVPSAASLSSAPRSPKSPVSSSGGRSGRSRGRSGGEDNDNDNDIGDDDERGRRGTRSRSKSRDASSRSRSSSRGPGNKEAAVSSSGKYRSTKAGHRERHKNSAAPNTPTTGFDTSAFGDSSDDPFGIGSSSAAAAAGRVDDGFGLDFAAFPSSDNNDGFGDFADFGNTNDFGSTNASPSGKQKRPPRPSRGSEPPRQAPFDEQAARSQNNIKAFRRTSTGGSSVGGGSVHSNASASGGNQTTRFRHSRTANPRSSLSRIRPSEQASRMHESNERRSAIKDSLFGALGDEDGQGGEISLDNFFGGETKRTGPRRLSDAGSIHSAPATTRPSTRSSRRMSTSSAASDDLQSAGQLHGKSRRYQRKMVQRGSIKESPTKQQQQGPVKLDIAALAQLGSIEVHEGKMRLVIDVDPA